MSKIKKSIVASNGSTVENSNIGGKNIKRVKTESTIIGFILGIISSIIASFIYDYFAKK